MLEIRNLHAYHGNVPALRGITLTAAKGKLLAIIGPNGAGKSTLLGNVAGLYRPRVGQVHLDGRDLTGHSAEDVVQAGIALVPEGRQVFASLSVRENLILGAYHRYRQARRGLEGELAEIFAIFPRLQERLKQAAGTLSGGEQQMLAIARGLMARPSVLLLDEPSIGLAPLVVKETMEVLARLRDERGVTIVLVEQNARAALKVADQVAVLERGEVAAQGTPAELMADARVLAAYLGKGYPSAAPGATG